MAKSELSLSVPAKMQYLKCIRGFLRPVFASRFDAMEQVDELVLAVDEACTNIIKYGQGWLRPRGRIQLEVVERRGEIEVRLLRFCKDKDVPKIKPRDLDDLRPGGLGTHIIRTIMDSVEFVPDGEKDGRMALVMIKDTTKQHTVTNGTTEAADGVVTEETNGTSHDEHDD